MLGTNVVPLPVHVYDMITCHCAPGRGEFLATNARELTWDAFSAADLRVGSITEAVCEAKSSSTCSSNLQTWDLKLNFGPRLGTMPCEAVLDSKVYTDCNDLLQQQVLAVTNLTRQSSNEDTSAHAVVLSVSGKALLQPAKPVSNGCKLA